MTIKSIAVVGAGTIGASWAVLFTTHGLEARLYDEAPNALDRAEVLMTESLAVLAKAGQLTGEAVEAAMSRVVKTGSLEEAIAGADFVQESVHESYEVKKPVFKRLDALCPPGMLIASSSSGLLMSELQAGLNHPERCLIAHPFNPPHLVPLVELVPGPQTPLETLERAKAFYLTVDKVPILLRKEVTGHIVNRLAAALWREAIALAVEGVASVADIDKAVYAGPGLRWAFIGQHLLYHMAGGPGGMENFLKHLGPAAETWIADLATWTEIPPEAGPVLIEGLKEEISGRTFKELQEWRDQALIKVVETARQARDENLS